MAEHWTELLANTRESILVLIKKYRETKDEIVLYNLQRMLQLRHDIIDYHVNQKQGKYIVWSTEPYY